MHCNIKAGGGGAGWESQNANKAMQSFFLPQERHFDQFRANKDKTLCPTQKRILRNYVNDVETRDNACIPTQSKHDMTSVGGLSSAKSNLLVVQ